MGAANITGRTPGIRAWRKAVNVNYTRYPGTAKLRYAGAAEAASSTKTAESGSSTAKVASSSSWPTDIVQISTAKAAADKLATGQAGTGASLKSRIDQLFQDARDAGTFITFDSSKGGVWMDLSSFTDDELGKIAVDKGGEFSNDLQEYARGALNARVKISLEPYENSVFNGDRRGHTMTINLLYDQMSPDARAALNWTPAMMASNNSMLEGDTKLFGKFSMATVLSNLLNAVQKGGLSFSQSDAHWTQSA